MVFEYIDVETMRKMCHPLAMAIFDTTEDPISKFDDHELNLLDSALQNPRQTFGGKDLYATLEEKAAILYYGLNKNHPFRNGNKRIATASLLTFLYINGYWINKGHWRLAGDKKEIEDYLVHLAIRVANLPPRNRDVLLQELQRWLSEHISPIEARRRRRASR